MRIKIGFIVNPIAGMGGRVGLKGTDNKLSEAKKLGAKPTAPTKAKDTITEFIKNNKKSDNIQWFTCAGDMGENELREAGVTKYTIIYTPNSSVTNADDTKNACRELIKKNIDLILFCGGDGTARDIVEVIDKRIPLLGIPAGVKMHSGVFGVTVQATARILDDYMNNNLTVGDVDILDVDEELYRKGEWRIRFYGNAKGIINTTYVQVGKATFESIPEDNIKDELAEHIQEEMKRRPDTLFLLGPGSTVEHIAKKMNLKKTLLGIDAVYKGEIIGEDLNEKQILELLGKHKDVKVVLSPIGAQGFILGRGNLQLSPEVIRRIGIDNIIVVATPAKLASTPFLRVDTGDKNLDFLFYEKEYLMVVIGYRLSRVVKIQKTINFNNN
jgi:predicted polyphosphate/ATP-dependent NAD kinase